MTNQYHPQMSLQKVLILEPKSQNVFAQTFKAIFLIRFQRQSKG